MKKSIIILICLVFTLTANSDVIFVPYQYAFFSYSGELIYSYEKPNFKKGSSVIWGGIGVVGSFIVINKPVAGIELAVERRYYFKNGYFKHFFISGYIGTAFMTNFNEIYDLGLIPGIKINYKLPLSNRKILEPYFSLSYPLSFNLRLTSMYIPLPVATIGIRYGFCKMKKNDND